MKQSSQINNFDALRFWAALTVLWSHCWELTQGSVANEPMNRLSGEQTTLGGLSVMVFFVISGYLITKSYDAGRDPWRFARARALRILPALVLVVLLSAFMLGPIGAGVSLRAFIATPEPWRYLTGHSLATWPAFPSNPSTDINGPLWTLRLEIGCYVLVFALGVTRLLNRYTTLFLYVGAVAMLLGAEHWQPGGELAAGFRRNTLQLTAEFLAGALIYQWRVPLRARFAWLALGIGVVCVACGGLDLAMQTALPYAVIFAALETKRRVWSPAIYGDWSYGTYIFAWPICQLVVLWLGPMNWWSLGAIATPITLLAAAASWHLLEKRALALKNPSVGEQRMMRRAAQIVGLG